MIEEYILSGAQAAMLLFVVGLGFGVAVRAVLALMHG